MAQDVRYEMHLDGVDKFEKSLGGMNNQVNSFERAIGNVGKKLAALFVIDKMVEFGKSIVDVGAKFEAYEIGLSTLLHGEKEAHDAFEQIKKDAQTTPFDTESLLMANRALISSGESAEGARQVVLDLGNAIAATGGGSDELSRMAVNLQQIKSIGHASAMDIKQFAFAGINIYELLAKSTGKNVEEVKKMSVSYDVLSKALKDAHSAGGLYEGGLEKMGKSTQVQLSNIKDTVQFLFVDIFKAIKPAIDASLGAFNNIIGNIKDIMPSILESFKPVWGIVKDISQMLFSVAKSILPEVLKMVRPIIDAFRITLNLVKALIDPIINELAPAFELIKDVLVDIVDLFKNIEPVLRPFMHIIGTVLAMMIKITVAIDRAIIGFITWISKIPFVVDLFNAIRSAIGWIIDKIEYAVKAVKAALEWLHIIDKKEPFKPSSTNLEEAKSDNLKDKLSKTGGGAVGGLPELKPASQSDKVTGTKQVIINVSIQKLVEMIKIMPQSVKDSASEIERHVANSLLSAVSQFSASADI